MIHTDSHSTEWLLEVRKNKFPQKDPTIIEKVIRALTLLEELKLAGLNFVFKGGTCLILILKDPKRFSIDIDITIDDADLKLESIFEKIIASGKFTHFEENKRENQKTAIPKQHFKFFYNSAMPKPPPNQPYILLDIVKHKSMYPKHKATVINSPFTKHHGDEVEIQTPTIESILGDKLTAFAPKTTGIRYGVQKELEIIKQLFDISRLFDDFNDLDEVFESFKNTALKELEYREMASLSEKDVLNDCIEASETIIFAGKVRNAEFIELTKGIKSFSGFVFDKAFNQEHANISSGKCAYLAKHLLNKNGKIKRYKSVDEIKNFVIEVEKYKPLQKLKKGNPEAFFYWYQVSKVDAGQ